MAPRKARGNDDGAAAARRHDPGAGGRGAGGRAGAAEAPHVSPPTSDDEDEPTQVAPAAAAVPRPLSFHDRRKQLLLLLLAAAYITMLLAVTAHLHLLNVYFTCYEDRSSRFWGGRGKRKRAIENSNYFQNLKSGSQHAFKAAFRLSRDQFGALLALVEPHHTHFGKVSVEEQLAMFLRWAGFGDYYSRLSNLFGVSKPTASEIIHSMARSIIMALDHTIDLSLPEVRTVAREETQQEERFRGFKNVVGAIDGTHIGVVPKQSNSVPAEDCNSEAWRNRKGWLSTNVIVICDLRGMIRFCIAGYEGRAHDQRIVSSIGLPSMLEQGQAVVLGDAGFGNSDAVLAPYRNVRYHPAEFGTADNAPRNSQELFNLRHASLRIKADCAIGVLKGTWQLLRHGIRSSPEFFGTAIRSCVCLHNFLLTANPHITIEDMVGQLRDVPIDPQALDDDLHDELLADPMVGSPREDPDSRRDRMARNMWSRNQKDLRSEVAAAGRNGALQVAAASLRSNVLTQAAPLPASQPPAQRRRVAASHDV